MSVRDANLASIELVARGLNELVERVAFVGGATVGLYIDDQAADDVRVTQDVDCVIELARVGDYAALENRLRELGFSNDTDEDAPVCRWHYRRHVVDVMPADGTALGFTNRWYPEAMQHLRSHRIADDLQVRIFPLSYFFASKLEAFKGRGHRDWRASHDLEDLVAVLDGSSSAERELMATSGPLGEYLRSELGRLAVRLDIEEILTGHLTPAPTRTERARRILRIIDTVATS